jgi:hypothetical protein
MPDNDKKTERAAQAAILWHGASAPELLWECAEALDKFGDLAEGEAMRDIADVAEQLLRSRP